MIKDLVANVSSEVAQDACSNYAISVAEAFDAHLVGIAFVSDVMMPPDFMASMPTAFIEEQRIEQQKLAKAAIDRFEAASRKAGLSAEQHIMDVDALTVSALFAQIARRFDLAIVGQAESEKKHPEQLIVEAALFESGRPVIVVPYIQTKSFTLDRVVICWDGGRAATRAIADAMPFLKRAKIIDVVMVTSESAKSDEIPGADIGQHLARHGLAVNIERLVGSGTDVSGSILSYVADASADFIVMGGYGHSRLREFILGGVTRSMLASMTAPTLLSH